MQKKSAPLRMPAEWEKQEAVWLVWPHHAADWPGKFEPIPWVFAEIIRHITPGQRVRLLVRDKENEKSVRHILKLAAVDLSQVDFYHIPTDRGWMRDCGPIFVRRGKEKIMLHWAFNGWAKYRNHHSDARVPQCIHDINRVPCLLPRADEWLGKRRIVLEGGAIDVNGKGSLLTTEECMLSRVQERNPGFSREHYEQIFEQYLGAPNVIWLGKGITGDDTHGHIDDLARFVASGAVVAMVEKSKRDDNHAPLQDNLKRLKAARDEKGRVLDVIELPMPRPVFFEGERLPASYANFLITNKAVLVPTFNDPADRDALSILAQCFKTRDVVGIHALDLVLGLGTLHCLTQQEPA